MESSSQTFVCVCACVHGTGDGLSNGALPTMLKALRKTKPQNQVHVFILPWIAYVYNGSRHLKYFPLGHCEDKSLSLSRFHHQSLLKLEIRKLN